MRSLSLFLRRFQLRITSKRTDILGREQGQALVRIAVSAIVLLYLIFHNYPIEFGEKTPQWFIVLSSFILFAAVIYGIALHDTRSPVYRRLIANVMDVAAISYLMGNTHEAGAPLFILYLWITLGNGFRFGVAPMATSATLSVIGFSIVVISSELWRSHTMLAVGVMAALAILPAYTAHLIRQLHKARERAEEASAAKGRFLARMSHELRTPLNGVLGTTDILLNNRRLTNEDRDLLGLVQESVSVSLRQIDSVLDFSKLEAGKMVIDNSDFSLNELINSMVRMIGSTVRDKNLRLLVRIASDVPFLLKGDPHHLREIILNLLSNAVKFTESGHVVLEVDLVDMNERNAQIRFEIRDTGIGIAPKALERIWDSFSQEDMGTTRRYGGTGLGTSIAKQLVELMGGHIDVASVKGRGSAFWFSLPFELQSEQDLTPRTVPGARVLVLTTDPDIIEGVQTNINGTGGNVVVVATVPEAVTAYTRGVRLGNLWHLVLVDKRIGVSHDNVHYAASLTEKTARMLTPVYLLSDSQRDTEQLYDWGYTAQLPFNPSPLETSRIIHASPHYTEQVAASPGVVRVEPWAWGRPGAKAPIPPRLLIADDNKTNRMILTQILESAGYEVESVADGEIALDRLLVGGYRAAVLDMHMPGLDGVELLRQYRLLHSGPAIPMIMLTADVTFEAKRDSADAGADAFLTKPAKSQTLLATLERLINDREVRVLSNIDAHRETEKVANEQALDLSVLAELDRLYHDPVKLANVIDTFESEGVLLLGQIANSVGTRNHSAYMEWVHALKGNAANVGAVRLVSACRKAESGGVLAFRRDGAAVLQEIHEHFDAAIAALRELVQPAATPLRIGPG